MSKSSELDQKVKLYILSCIDNSEYSDEVLNTKQKIEFLNTELKTCFQWRIDQIGPHAALAEFISKSLYNE